MLLAIVQARLSSSRLPEKVLLPLHGQPMILRQIERLRRARLIDKLIVATSTSPDDDKLYAVCRDAGVECYRGAVDDVLDRFYQAAKHYEADYVVRLTGDCPLHDPAVIDELVQFFFAREVDYANNSMEPTYPDGLDAEIFSFGALEITWREARLRSEREHATPYFYTHPERFRLACLKRPVDLSHLRWTVDEPEDFEFVSEVYQELYDLDPGFSTADILRLLERRPDLARLNAHYERDAGLARSRRQDQLFARYIASQQMLSRALKTIPLGSQTFSKSRTQYPEHVSPLFITHGQGSQAWDIDGNQYTDFINGLCAINLGYNDPEVNAAVRAQLDKGVIFSLPHPLEVAVAEKIVELVPCAEMVRFGKNGSDATSGAIRLSRAYTGRDHVAVCGYHGWHDWYIGSTARNRGVPQSTRDLTHLFDYNNIESLEEVFSVFPGQVAAVIMEPMNVEFPKANFLEDVQALARRHGALLIFDETITGFRLAAGGAQELFNVTPDLATFGKGMANGFPISAIAGKAEIMKLLEEIFFSFTFGGEALSLAACLATLEKIQREPVIKTLSHQGTKLQNGVNELIRRHRLEPILDAVGHPAWSFLKFRDAGGYSLWQIKTLFLQEVFRRGLLTLGTHNMSYAHRDQDIEMLLTVYDQVFPILGEAVASRRLDALLLVPPIQPLFRTR